MLVGPSWLKPGFWTEELETAVGTDLLELTDVWFSSFSYDNGDKKCG